MDFSKNDQFQRTALLIGRENIEKLRNRHVAVFGVGGVGGYSVEALCRAGIGKIDVFDGDVVDITNINRQLIATHKTLGRNKVDVIKERMLEINPEVIIGAHKIFYLPESADSVDLSVYDYIIDAVDTMTAKIELVCRAINQNVPVICSMGAANKLNPTAFEVADIYETTVCPMARIMRKELRKRGVEALKVVYSKEPVPLSSERSPLQSSISFVPPVAGFILAGEVIKDLMIAAQPFNID
ncbi:MAG: tRNA threonylcarbamoyladenosine dehydratase [Oscillospiraceae bacterium]|nr:tRNA threonylcarbamoyladenosine dehydratase [Oscillospiraceae bacterium]